MTIRDVLDRTDLAEILTELSGPPASGRVPRWRCCHRDHDDEHPSVTITRDRHGTERWRCWSGGHGGTAIDAIIGATGATIGDAVTRLEQRAGIQPAPTPRRPTPQSRGVERRLSTPASDYLSRCAELLWTPAGAGALEWLHQRGLADQILTDNLVGFDPGPGALTRASGLPIRGGVTYVSFDQRGQPVYVQTRHLGPPTRWKYSNPTAAHGPQPLVAHPRTSVGRGPLIVTEGIADALIATTAGFRAVAVLSASTVNGGVAAELVAIGGADGVVVAFDNDPAGRAAEQRLVAHLAGRIGVRVLRLPDGHDLTDTFQRSRPCAATPNISSINSIA